MSSSKLRLALVVILALFLRVAGVAREPLTTNEATTAALAADPLAVAVQKTAHDVHPPFHYVFLNLWSRVFGTGEVSLRLPSVLAGTLTVGIVWAWARAMLPPGAAVLAGLVVALSPYHVHYSQEARFYAFLGLASAAFWLCLWHLLWRPSRAWLVAALVALVVGLYTHYYFGFLALSLLLLAIIRVLPNHEGWRSFRPWVVLGVLAGAAYAPWLPIVLRHARGPGAGSTGPVSVGIIQHTFRYFLSYGPDVQPWRALSFAILALILVLGLFRWVLRKDRALVYLPLGPAEYLSSVGFVSTAAVVFAVCTVKPLYISKGMIVVLPAYAMLTAAAWLRFRTRWAQVLFALALGALVARGLLVFYGTPRNTDWPGIAQRLSSEAAAGDVLLLREGLIHVPLHYYYMPHDPEGRLPEIQLDSTGQTHEEQMALVRESGRWASHVWLVRGHTTDSAVRDELLGDTAHYRCLGRWDYRGAELLRLRPLGEGRADVTRPARGGAGDSGA